jgi:RimJ/RimL family protein N-acetyltransferase
VNAVSFRQLGAQDLSSFLAYLAPHMNENGRGNTALFQPQSRSVPYPVADKGPRFLAAWEKPLSEPGWSRAWGAFHENGNVVGHADVRARPEPYTNHRALLGVGVDSKFRNQGIAKHLVQLAMNWAKEQQNLAWLDLQMLGGNAPARAVYEHLGFVELVSVPDMFRIDGQSVADVIMTKGIR